MKHTIEGCLIKYNVPTVNGHYFSPEAFKDVTGTMVPISTNYAFDASESKIIGYAKLENREDGVYYKATLNDEKTTDDMIDLVKNHNYFLGIYANKIKLDPENRKCVVDGKIRAMAFTLKCDDSACVLTIDDEPFVAVKKSEIDESKLKDALETINDAIFKLNDRKTSSEDYYWWRAVLSIFGYDVQDGKLLRDNIITGKPVK